jgi:hypothetical protein
MTHTGDGCMRCQTPMESVGVEGFRTSGPTSTVNDLVGDWADPAQDMLPLEVLTCRNCGYVELRRPRPEPANA